MSKAVRPISELETFLNIPSHRVQSLYSDQSQQKSLNPDTYQSTIQWWSKTLEAYVTRGWQSDSPDVLVLHAGSELPLKFRYEGIGRPLGLHTIVADLRDTQKIISLDRFLNSQKSIYDHGSILYRFASLTLGKPLWWALQRLNIFDDGYTQAHESEASRWKNVASSYVIIHSLEKATETVLRHQRHNAGTAVADSLYDFASFKDVYGKKGVVFPDVELSHTDIRVIIKFLSRDKNSVATDGKVIKFVDYEPDESLRIITAVDKGILELKIGIQALDEQVADLQKKIQDRTEQASTSLRDKRKDVVMLHLRSRKQFEEVLKQRLRSLETLQSTMIQVETAAGNIEIMKQYESSTATLRDILSHPSLQHDRIEETMDAMAEAAAQQREIDEAIRVGGDAALAEVGIDESELEKELEGMVREVKREEEEKENAEKEKKEAEVKSREEEFQLPSPPSGHVSEGETPVLETSVQEIPPDDKAVADDEQPRVESQRAELAS